MNATLLSPVADGAVGAAFVAHLPRIEAHARYAVRHLGCPDARAELVAETVGLAWKHFLALTRRGKEPGAFVATLALRCSQAARGGRRVAGSDSARDALSPVARARHRFRVERLPDYTRPPDLKDDPLVTEALAADPKARVPEQAAFRVDFPAWRARLRARERAVLDALAGGAGTGEVAAQFGLSASRVSQLRADFAASWEAFHRGE